MGVSLREGGRAALICFNLICLTRGASGACPEQRLRWQGRPGAGGGWRLCWSLRGHPGEQKPSGSWTGCCVHERLWAMGGHTYPPSFLPSLPPGCPGSAASAFANGPFTVEVSPAAPSQQQGLQVGDFWPAGRWLQGGLRPRGLMCGHTREIPH